MTSCVRALSLLATNEVTVMATISLGLSWPRWLRLESIQLFFAVASCSGALHYGMSKGFVFESHKLLRRLRTLDFWLAAVGSILLRDCVSCLVAVFRDSFALAASCAAISD